MLLRRLGFFLLFPLGAAFAQVNETPMELKDIDIQEHLGGTVPLDIQLTTAEGGAARLGDYLGKNKPIVLNLAYYECPMLCTLVLNGVAEAMKTSGLVLGKDFEAVTVSINPDEPKDLPLQKKEVYLKELGADYERYRNAWHFHTASKAEIQRLADSVGFKFKQDPVTKEYAHAAVTFILTPEGKISRYLYGAQYKPKNFKLALLEAGQDHIGTSLEKILLYCYHYDPNAKGYVLMATRVMSLGGLIFVAVLSLFLGTLWFQERRKKNNTVHSEAA